MSLILLFLASMGTLHETYLRLTCNRIGMFANVLFISMLYYHPP